MKIKVSDYIISVFEKLNINTLFTITGGFAMHLNDSFGKNKFFNILYQHHEQACGYAAVGFTKITNKPSIVCTTAGCAATNAITPCLVAYQDSVLVIFISGQVKSTETTSKMNNSEMKLRHYAGADSEIINIVKDITIYSKEIYNVNEVVPVMEELVKHLYNGRRGPIWLSIPLDIQGAIIEVEPYEGYQLKDINVNIDNILDVHKLLKESKRPVLLLGNGCILSDCRDKVKSFIEKYQIPVVVSMMGTDLIESDNKLYCGKLGLIGDRCGNFVVQNSDLVISLGCRMAQGIIGYRGDWFAREAKIVYIDIDENELMKNNVNYTLKMKMNLKDFFDNYKYESIDYSWWIEKCNQWKNKWFYEMPINMKEDIINPYPALKKFFDMAPENKSIICSSGSIVTNLWHMINIRKNDRFIISSQGDMGFELPASIGCNISGITKYTIPILGEGSFQLNIQELQTIIQYKLPIKILLFNNNSYGAIEITQRIFFGNKFGVDTTSGISFPDTQKICLAYGLNYISIRKYEEMNDKYIDFFNCEGPVICEVFCCNQVRTPKLSARKNEDGSFTNRPLEDLEPFLDRNEFENEMIVKLI